MKYKSIAIVGGRMVSASLTALWPKMNIYVCLCANLEIGDIYIGLKQ